MTKLRKICLFLCVVFLYTKADISDGRHKRQVTRISRVTTISTVSPSSSQTTEVTTISTSTSTETSTATSSLTSAESSTTTSTPTPTATPASDLEAELIAILQPERISSTTEQPIAKNISFRINFEYFFDQIDIVSPIIMKKLQDEKKKQLELFYFKERPDYYYSILKPHGTFNQILKLCRRKQAELYEIDTVNKFKDLRKLVDRENQTLGERTFWLNVKITNSETIEYSSGKPMLTVLEIGQNLLSLPSTLEKGKCVYFNTPEKEYQKAACNSYHFGICYIEKTPEVRESVLFYKSLDDKIIDLTRLKIGKIDRNQLKRNLERLNPSSCEETNSQSLLDKIGFNEPIDSFLTTKEFNPIVFTALFPQLLNDIQTIRDLARTNSFEARLRTLLQAGEEVRIVYDKTKNLVCSKPYDPHSDHEYEEQESPESTIKEGDKTNMKKLEEFLKFNLTDLILSLTSLVIAIIAIANSFCLLCMTKNNPPITEMDDLTDVRLSEVVSRKPSTKKVAFKKSRTDKIKSINHQSSLSSLSLPSPIPARNN